MRWCAVCIIARPGILAGSQGPFYMGRTCVSMAGAVRAFGSLNWLESAAIRSIGLRVRRSMLCR